ncbi:hypothetical protein V6615_13960 [Oscillospiraceae bacterium PP1C4]
MAQEAEESVEVVCADGLTSTMNMEKVRSQSMGTHFSIVETS